MNLLTYSLTHLLTTRLFDRPFSLSVARRIIGSCRRSLRLPPPPGRRFRCLLFTTTPPSLRHRPPPFPWFPPAEAFACPPRGAADSGACCCHRPRPRRGDGRQFA